MSPPQRSRWEGASLVVQWLRLCAPNSEGLDSIPTQGTRSHMPQLSKSLYAALGILQAAAKTWHGQITTFFKWKWESQGDFKYLKGLFSKTASISAFHISFVRGLWSPCLPPTPPPNQLVKTTLSISLVDDELFFLLTKAFDGRMMPVLSHFRRVRLCATPQTAAHQAPPSLGFSRQEHWSGLPFPSPVQESEKWKWSRSVVSNS